MPPKDFNITKMNISELIQELEKILAEEGDLPVCTHNNGYMDNQFGMPVDYIRVEENPEPMIGVIRYRNPALGYKGKVVFID